MNRTHLQTAHLQTAHFQMPLLRAALFRKVLLHRDRLPGRLLNPVLRKYPGRLRRICLWKRHLPGSSS